MWELDHKKVEHWRWFQTVVFDKTLESPLDCKEIKSVNPTGNQPWKFTGRTAAKAKALILGPPDVKSQRIGKDPEAGKVRVGGERVGRGWDVWMASPIQWTWVWANSGRKQSTGKPGVLQAWGCSQTRLSDWTTTSFPRLKALLDHSGFPLQCHIPSTKSYMCWRLDRFLRTQGICSAESW